MFYLINKESGISSFKCISNFARKHHIRKIGHTGTLDPLASGLLLVATNDDTKLIGYIDKGWKSYVVTMKFGYKSNTLDIDGEVTKTVDSNLDKEEVFLTINSFVKTYDQIPPDFSAKKINGKRAYKLAREGQKLELSSSRVTINKINLITMIDEETYQFEVEVSRGTYIRSLIRDIAAQLNTHAIMTKLIRIKIADLTLDDVDKNIDVRKLLKMNTINVSKEIINNLFMGKKIEIKKEDGKYALEYGDDIIGIIDIENNFVKKRKLFGNKYKEYNEGN